MEITVIINTYNDETALEEIVKCINAQTIRPKEIVIVDGGSSDNTIRIITQLSEIYDNIIPITGKRLNIAEAFNEGIRHSNNELLFLTSTGNYFPNDLLEKLYSYLHQENADIVSPTIKAYKDNSFSEDYEYCFLNKGRGSNGMGAANHGSLMKKRIFEDYGCFYEKFIYAGEDAEYFEYVRKRGGVHVWNKNSIIYWNVPQNWEELFKQKNYYSIGNIQIAGVGSILKIGKKSLFEIAVIIIGLICCILNVEIGCLLLTISLLYELVIFFSRGSRRYLMRLYRIYSPFYYIVKNRKYLSRRYRVYRR